MEQFINSSRPVHVIGAGLAGSEATWQLVRRGIPVILHEMRPGKSSPAHKTEFFAELVCSNSFRAANVENAVGLLKEEMRRLDSIIMKAADANRVPAGGALAVDRDMFAKAITNFIREHPDFAGSLRLISEWARTAAWTCKVLHIYAIYAISCQLIALTN